MTDPLLLRGVAEFNHGHFFEAHELWEEAWQAAVGEEKSFYQGLVQLAVGYHKLLLAQRNGARKLFERGQQILLGFPAGYAGVDLGPLLEITAATLSKLVTDHPLTTFPTPTVRLLSTQC